MKSVFFKKKKNESREAKSKKKTTENYGDTENQNIYPTKILQTPKVPVYSVFSTPFFGRTAT
jgi:hypothetical protein